MALLHVWFKQVVVGPFQKRTCLNLFSSHFAALVLGVASLVVNVLQTEVKELRLVAEIQLVQLRSTMSCEEA